MALHHLDAEAVHRELCGLRAAFIQEDGRFAWQEMRRSVKRLRALLPADLELVADEGLPVRQLDEFLWLLSEVHHLDADEGEITLPMEPDDRQRLSDLLRGFEPDPPAWAPEDGEQADEGLVEGQDAAPPVKASAIEALLSIDDVSQDILKVANSNRTVDDKLRDICGIDRRFVGLNSTKWAELLGKSTAAIRKTQFWKEHRDQAKEAAGDE